MPKVLDEDEDSLYVQPDDGGVPVRMAKVPGLLDALNAPPPEPKPVEKYPWETWSEDQKQKMAKAIEAADGVKLYRSAGGIGVGTKYAAASEALEQRGGLTKDEATTLARYKMFRETTGGDPDWQGPLNINNGPREAPETPEQIEQKRDALFASSRDERRRMLAEEAAKVARSREGFYDDLVKDGSALGKSLAKIDEKRKRG